MDKFCPLSKVEVSFCVLINQLINIMSLVYCVGYFTFGIDNNIEKRPANS